MEIKSAPQLRKDYQLSPDLAVIVARANLNNPTEIRDMIRRIGESQAYDGEGDRAIKYLRQFLR